MTSENSNNTNLLNGSGAQTVTQDPWERSRSSPANEDDELTASMATRSEAENARQNIANEILEAAKTVCQELISDTERTLEKARYLESEADRKHVEAHEDRELAAAIRLEAEEYRESLIEDGKRQSAELIERDRAAVERECAELKERASIETEKMVAQAQVMRAAASEELEAQKIYAEAAKFQASSQETLSQARSRLDKSRTSALLKPAGAKATDKSAPATETATEKVTDPGQDPAGHQDQIDRATAIALGDLNLDPTPEPSDAANDAMDSLLALRTMQEAASKAVDKAAAKENKPASVKRKTRSKKTTTK